MSIRGMISNLAALLAACLLLLGCAKTEYLGNSAKGFWSEEAAKIPPNEAFRRAMPHLEATWKARCETLRHQDEWCEKHPTDHMVRRGDYYYITRTSYPYKAYDAYLKYAVKVDVNSGEVIPFE